MAHPETPDEPGRFPIIEVTFTKDENYVQLNPAKTAPDTPFGLGLERGAHGVASYTGEELAAGMAAADAGRSPKGLGAAAQAGDPAVLPPPVLPSGRAEIIRPIEDPEALQKLATLRQTIEEIMRAGGVAPLTLPTEQLEGVAILQESFVEVARRSPAVRQLGTVALLERVMREQPVTAGKPFPASKVAPYFFGGPRERRKSLGLIVRSGTIENEVRTAARTVRAVTYQDTQPPKLIDGHALIMLAHADEPGMLGSMQEALTDAVRRSGIIRMPINYGVPVNHLATPEA